MDDLKRDIIICKDGCYSGTRLYERGLCCCFRCGYVGIISRVIEKPCPSCNSDFIWMKQDYIVHTPIIEFNLEEMVPVRKNLGFKDIPSERTESERAKRFHEDLFNDPIITESARIVHPFGSNPVIKHKIESSINKLRKQKIKPTISAIYEDTEIPVAVIVSHTVNEKLAKDAKNREP